MTEAAHQPLGRTVGRKKSRKSKLRGGADAIDLCAVAAELRAQALDVKRDALAVEGSIYGMVLDTAYEDRITSLVVLADGSTSWYVSTGHGCIGCGCDAEVRLAAQKIIARATTLQSHTTLAADRLQPLRGRVRLFLLSDAGLTSMEGPIDIASRAPVQLAQPQTTLLIDVYTDAQRLLQLIERRGAGNSLEHEVATLVAEMSATETPSNIQTSEPKACLSAGSAARRLRI